MGLIDLIRRKLSGDNGNADIRIQLPASEDSPPDAVFIGEKKISVCLAPAPGEEHLQQFAGDMTKTQLVEELLEVPPEHSPNSMASVLSALLLPALFAVAVGMPEFELNVTRLRVL